MKHSFILSLPLLILSILLPLPSAHAQADTPSTLNVITYNVQFLPGPASTQNKRAEPQYRAKRIAEEMTHFDIVALQEVFEEKYRQPIIDEMRTAWGDTLHSLASPKAKGHLFTGGCLIVTRFPIVESHTMVFQHFSSPKDYGFRADGFAAKGVIHARINIDPKNPDHCVDVFATHLEARDDALRPLQYAEMADFIKQYASPDNPILLLGDLNTKGMESFRNDPDSQYTALTTTLTNAVPKRTLQDIWPLLHPKALGGTTHQESADIGKRIDYILLANPSEPALQLTPKTIKVDLYQDKKVVALSDHNAVTTQFTWSKK